MSESYLLKEDGDYLLQENGDKIIIDTVSAFGLISMRGSDSVVTLDEGWGIAPMRGAGSGYPLTMDDDAVL